MDEPSAARKLVAEKDGGHNYRESIDCRFHCRCWMGKYRFGGPPGLDPYGKCPNNPKNSKRGVRLIEHI